MKKIEKKRFDEERALYNSHDIFVYQCAFDGPQDGESAMKESSNILAEECYFNLRYPFWHDIGVRLERCEMTELCRAALWYCEHIVIKDTKMHGIKALRECSDIVMENCDVVSQEFGWFVKDVRIQNCQITSEYFMMRSENIEAKNLNFKGKYSFQYIKNSEFEDCHFDTKDAFWHAKNITIKNCIVKGEYLAWYSENLTFENCEISGTQPFCYCKNLKLVNCKMLDADLCFEKSEVDATLTTPVISIKNPLSGKITLPSVGAIIRNDPASKAEIHCTQKEE